MPLVDRQKQHSLSTSSFYALGNTVVRVNVFGGTAGGSFQ